MGEAKVSYFQNEICKGNKEMMQEHRALRKTKQIHIQGLDTSPSCGTSSVALENIDNISKSPSLLNETRLNSL